MDVVTVSPKYQVMIPRAIRESLGIKAGQKVQIFRYLDRVEIMPVTDIRESRGFLKGIETSVEREGERV